MSSSDPILQIRELSKSFGGAQALDRVSLTIRPGEVHALLGENGSGKSTLIKILAGFHAPEAGQVTVNGSEVKLPLSPGESQQLGFEFVHQDLGLVASLTVTENLFIEDIAHPRSRIFMSWSAARIRAKKIFASYSLDIDPKAVVADLRPVERAMLAIVRAMEGLTHHAPDAPTLLILDEPTVFLPAQEVRQLFDFARTIVGKGSSVLFVSHDLDEVKEIADRVTVLRDGRLVGETSTADITTEDLVRLIVGGDLKDRSPMLSSRVHSGSVLLEVEGLTTGRVTDVNLEVHSGEILGLTGLVGSGYEDVIYALFGAVEVTAGRMLLAGTSSDLCRFTPQRALESSIALVPGDRQRLGSVADLSVAENINLLVLNRFSCRGRLRYDDLDANASSLLSKFDVRPPRGDIAYASLSGGNQQKVLIAKWLQTDPRLLLLDEPTQGVDVGARQQIWDAIRDASKSASIICASSDHEQLAALCDRVGVFVRGGLMGFLGGPELTKERLTEFCLRGTLADAGPRF